MSSQEVARHGEYYAVIDGTMRVDRTRGLNSRSSGNSASNAQLLALYVLLVEARAPYTVVGGWHPLFHPTSRALPPPLV